MMFLHRSTINYMCPISQGPAEDDLDGEDDVGQRPTPPASSPGPQEGHRSHSSSPTFPRRPTAHTETRSPSPEQCLPSRSTAQQSVVGMGPPRQQLATNANQLASSSQGSHDPPAPSAPPTFVAKSQAPKLKKPPIKRRKKNY